MKDKESNDLSDTCHIFVAIFRKKDNKQSETQKEKVFRQIIHGDNAAIDLDQLYLRIRSSTIKGKWRIYVTANRRDKRKAVKIMLHKLLDATLNSRSIIQVESMWKATLLEPECRAEKNFILDCDSQRGYEEAMRVLKLHDIGYQGYKTPNGWHLLVPPFDTRIRHEMVCDPKEVELKRDGMLYVETIDTTRL
jgi:hypothetical protein